jgi:NADPH:quinone reductase-like Zn-dependent oxidoreductase
VGSLVIQLAAAPGARVDGLVSRAGHIAEATKLGAASMLTSRELLEPAAYDSVFDSASIDPGAALKSGGKYVSITDDPLSPIPGAEKPEVYEEGRMLRQLTGLVASGALTVHVAAYYPITEVREAHRRFEVGGLGGKLILLF